MPPSPPPPPEKEIVERAEGSVEEYESLSNFPTWGGSPLALSGEMVAPFQGPTQLFHSGTPP